jgi:hypothetical protein
MVCSTIPAFGKSNYSDVHKSRGYFCELRRYATSRKVAGSSPSLAINFFLNLP